MLPSHRGTLLRCRGDHPLAIQVWFRQYSPAHWDYATLASAQSVEWAKANGYHPLFITGYVFATGSEP
jgi:hypothetical protein